MTRLNIATNCDLCRNTDKLDRHHILKIRKIEVYIFIRKIEDLEKSLKSKCLINE